MLESRKNILVKISRFPTFTRKVMGFESLTKNYYKKKLGPVTKKDMQISPPPPPPLRSGHLYIINAQWAVTNENSCIRFFQFLVFELLLPKRLQRMRKKIAQNRVSTPLKSP